MKEFLSWKRVEGKCIETNWYLQKWNVFEIWVSKKCYSGTPFRYSIRVKCLPSSFIILVNKDPLEKESERKRVREREMLWKWRCDNFGNEIDLILFCITEILYIYLYIYISLRESSLSLSLLTLTQSLSLILCLYFLLFEDDSKCSKGFRRRAFNKLGDSRLWILEGLEKWLESVRTEESARNVNPGNEAASRFLLSSCIHSWIDLQRINTPVNVQTFSLCTFFAFKIPEKHAT